MEQLSGKIGVVKWKNETIKRGIENIKRKNTRFVTLATICPIDKRTLKEDIKKIKRNSAPIVAFMGYYCRCAAEGAVPPLLAASPLLFSFPYMSKDAHS